MCVLRKFLKFLQNIIYPNNLIKEILMTEEQKYQVKQLKNRLYEMGYNNNSVVKRLNNNLYKIDGVVYFIGDIDPTVLDKALKKNRSKKLSTQKWQQLHRETAKTLSDYPKNIDENKYEQ